MKPKLAVDTATETAPAQEYTSWEAIMALLDTPSSDGRILASTGMTVRPLPLTLAFMPATDDGHDGSYPVGRIDEVWVDGDKLMGRGEWDSSPEAQDAARMVSTGVMTEISIDPTLQVYTQRYPLDWNEEIVQTEDGGEAIEVTESVDDYLMTYSEWEFAGATIVNGAAFSDTKITITAAAEQTPPPVYFAGSRIATPSLPAVTAAAEDNETGVAAMIALYPDPSEAQVLSDGPEDVPAEEMHLTLCVFNAEPDTDTITALLGDFASQEEALAGDVTGVACFAAGPDGVPMVALADVLGLVDLRCDLTELLEAAGIPYATDHDFMPHITMEYQQPPGDAAGDDPAIGQALTFTQISYVLADGTRVDYPFAEAMTAVASGHAPERPPLAWMQDPQLDGPTPITITDEGRVYGHAALFGVCHTAMSGRCLQLDQLRSAADYAYFHTGYLVTEEGDQVRVGQITLGTDHPSTSVRDLQAVAEHYANTGTSAADVCVGEDEHGLWVAGALRPEFPANRLRELRASVLSGDWRPIKRAAELMALLAVNVPGFPIVAPEATIASGSAESDPPALAAVAVGMILPGMEIASEDPRAEHQLAALRAARDGLAGLREAAGIEEVVA